ncbi:reverse transcriptase domain-containing protein, partial [Paenibacillus odorifer]
YIADINISESVKLIDFIMKTVSLAGEIPQGAVTSPVLSNIYFRSLDIRINRYCKKFNITYSRYVDDLLFSSNDLFIHKEIFANGISKILRSAGLTLNSQKLIKTKKEISLNGFVIGNELRLSRKKTQYLSSIIYCYQRARKKNLTEFTKEIHRHFQNTNQTKIDYVWLHNYLAGYRSFLLGILPFDSIG